MKLPIAPEDKANHFIYGSLVALVVGAIAWVVGIGDVRANYAGLIAGVVVGILKEYADYRANQKTIAAGQPVAHGVEVGDSIATGLGALVVFLARWSV